MKALICILALAGVLHAQQPAQPQSCPIQIEEFRYYGENLNGHPGRAALKLANTTSQTITAAVLNLAAVDAVGDAHDFIVTPALNMTRPIKSGETKKATWDLHTRDNQKLKVWVSAVRFADGTVWHDDSSRSCSK